MKPAICEQFGIDFPLFAFSHCRDVVAAVTNAGGFGVLGGTAFTPEQLDQELSWIDEQVGGKPYGLDLIVPAKFEGKGEKVSSADLAARIPDEVRGLRRRPTGRRTTSNPTPSRSSVAPRWPAPPAENCSRRR